MQAKWLKIDKEQGGKIFKEVPSISDAVQEQLKQIQAGTLPAKADIDKLKKRKMIADAKYKTYKVMQPPPNPQLPQPLLSALHLPLSVPLPMTLP